MGWPLSALLEGGFFDNKYHKLGVLPQKPIPIYLQLQTQLQFQKNKLELR